MPVVARLSINGRLSSFVEYGARLPTTNHSDQVAWLRQLNVVTTQHFGASIPSHKQESVGPVLCEILIDQHAVTLQNGQS